MELKELMQPHIGTEITIEYGFIGMKYLHVLVVKDGKIISIGSFLYKIFREDMLNRGTECEASLIEAFAKEADKYLKGKRDKAPTLCYVEDKLKIS